MSVKIINVLKDDSFNDILELFRQASQGEVILVLPRVGKLFRHEDHFAAFASEAAQAGKTVSVLTANPQTAQLARKFGFNVMASGTSKTAKPAATLATAPVPADFSTRDFDDAADLGDVPLTSDQTMAETPEDSEDADPDHMMHIIDPDEDGEEKPVDANEDGAIDEPTDKDLTVGDEAGFVSAPSSKIFATLAASKTPPVRPMQGNDIDGVRLAPKKTITPAPVKEAVTSVPVQTAPIPVDADADYIDTVWRERANAGRMSTEAIVPPTTSKQPSFLSRAMTSTANAASGASMPRRVAASILGAAIVVLIAVVYLMTGTAHVALAPVGKPVDTQITVQASDVFTSVDDAFAKIPGQLIDVSKSSDNTVTATGKRDVASKARGKITVYNEYSSTPQALVATTRFKSPDGKIFRTLQAITVPGSTVNAGQTVAGHISVDVIADQPGPDYNIAAGRFTIAAFEEKGATDKVEKFYGKSDAPMTGGASGPSSVITQADYDKAKDAATAAVKDQVSAALSAQGADLMVLDADAPAMADVKSTAQPDDAAQSVTVTATGTVKTVAFRKADLMQLIASTILKKDRLVVQPDKLQLSYSDTAFKSDLGTLVFTVTIKGTGYMPVDEDAIKRDIAGKDSSRIRDYFRDKEGIQSATVTLSPFWVRKVPANPSKITIELLYSTSGI